MDKVNILMVDDQPGKLLAYEAILGGLGENLIKADSGRAALECLLKTDIAVVLLDVGMPELDGFEVAGPEHRRERLAASCDRLCEPRQFSRSALRCPHLFAELAGRYCRVGDRSVSISPGLCNGTSVFLPCSVASLFHGLQHYEERQSHADD